MLELFTFLKVKPIGSVEYCCIVKSAQLHSRVARPKSALESRRRTGSRPSSAVSFAWTSSSPQDTPDIHINGQEADTDNDSDSNSDQDMETHLHAVPEEDITQQAGERTNLDVSEEANAGWTDKIDLANKEGKSSAEEDGLVIQDLILEDIDMNEDKDNEDGMSLDALGDEDDTVDSNQ